MNHEQLKKVELFIVICLLLVGFLTFFPRIGLTGHVSTDLSTQHVDINIAKSQIFHITTSDAESFNIVSFKISGEIIGDGIAEVYLDNGQGQELLVFNNVKLKETGIGGLTGITAKVIGVEEQFEEVQPEKVLLIKPGEIIDNMLLTKPTEEEEVFNGNFESECDETCFIEMELNAQLGYNLIFKLEDGTSVHLTKIQYIVKEGY